MTAHLPAGETPDVRNDSRPVIFTLGWDLAHEAIDAIDVTETARLAHCDALFLAAGSLAEFWQRAVGHPICAFRSAEYEQQCWSRLTAFGHHLRCMLRRDGVLFVRLDRPEIACRVTHRGSDSRLPIGSPVDVYDALAAVDPLLELVARQRQLLDGSRTGPLMVTGDRVLEHVFAPYLWQATHNGFASVALAGVAELARPLLTTRSGAWVAASSEQIVLLPPVGVTEPSREASLLLAVLDRMMTVRRGNRWSRLTQEPWLPDICDTNVCAEDPARPARRLADGVLTADERAALSLP